jgi:hypothetical protein
MSWNYAAYLNSPEYLNSPAGKRDARQALEKKLEMDSSPEAQARYEQMISEDLRQMHDENENRRGQEEDLKMIDKLVKDYADGK